MTIAIALQVHDGVVLASDSALTLNDPTKSGPESILNVYNNGNKIFNLLKGFPIGAVFYGAGSIGTSSVPTLVKDLRRRFADESPTTEKRWKLNTKSYTIEEVAKKARDFIFEEHFAPLNVTAPGTQFGLIVAGYSSSAQLSEVWTFEIRDGKCDMPRQILPQGHASWYAGGDPEVVCRIANGIGNGAAKALGAEGVSAGDVAKFIGAIQAECGTALVEAPMPIQDAIDLAEFFVNTTTTFTRFKRGAGTVGGPTESAAITKHEGFKWVRRKYYFDESLKPEGSQMTNFPVQESMRNVEAVTDFRYQWSPVSSAVSAQPSSDAAYFSQSPQVGSASHAGAANTPPKPAKQCD